MILLQTGFLLRENDSSFSWILLFLIIGLVVYRIFISLNLHQTSLKKEESGDIVQRGKKSPLENLLHSLVRGLDGQLINSARFESPLLAAIFTKTQLRITTYSLILVAVLFILGAWQVGLLALGIITFGLWFHSSRYTYVWKKEEGGKDILTGLYWYYKDVEKSLEYLMKASDINSDPFIAYLIAKKLDKIESLKPEEERACSDAIDWYEQVVEHSKYDIKESLNSLIWLKIQEGQYEDALHYLAILKSEYEVESPRGYLAAYFGLGEENELQSNLDEAIEYYEQALEISPELQSNIPCIITSKLTFLYSRIGEFNNSKAKAEQLLKFYLAGEFQNKKSTSKPTFNEFIEDVSYPFKCTADIEGFVSMLSRGINSNTSEEMVIKLKSYLAEFLRAVRRKEQTDVIKDDLLEVSKSKWDWDQVITICDERIPENQGNKTYYYLALIKALLYKGKLDEALVNLDSLIELQNQDNSFKLPDEDFHLFARLYQTGCQKG